MLCQVCAIRATTLKTKNNTCGLFRFIIFNDVNTSSLFFLTNCKFGKKGQPVYNTCFTSMLLNGRMSNISNYSDCESNPPPLYIEELPNLSAKKKKKKQKKTTRSSDRGEVRVHINVDLDKRHFLCVSPLMHAQMSPPEDTHSRCTSRAPHLQTYTHTTRVLR